MRRILFVANGHGETAIAACIAEHVLARTRGPAGVDLLPLVGIGAGAEPLALVGPRAEMPSGGLVAMGNVRALGGDFRAGYAGLLARQASFLRGTHGRYDAVVAVGDAFALALALLVRERTVFVGTAKSVYVAPYGPFERSLLRRSARAFVRDAPTAAALRARDVRAEAPGNVIVDMVRPGIAPAGDWLGILPGSRIEAYADAVRLARVARALGARRPGLGGLMSIAPTVDAGRLARGLAADGWSMEAAPDGAPFAARFGSARLVGWRGAFGALLEASVAVLGQAGTANEQAAAFGVPVVALSNARGGREDWYRMRQRRLLGDALLLVGPETERAATELEALLADGSRLERMRAAGPARMGPRGGADAIARAIIEVAA